MRVAADAFDNAVDALCAFSSTVAEVQGLVERFVIMLLVEKPAAKPITFEVYRLQFDGITFCSGESSSGFDQSGSIARGPE